MFPYTTGAGAPEYRRAKEAVRLRIEGWRGHRPPVELRLRFAVLGYDIQSTRLEMTVALPKGTLTQAAEASKFTDKGHGI